jgi:flagellar L-ring protein precursor FlgH
VSQYAPSQTPNGAIYQAGNGVLLFEDMKARKAGDLITVILDEQTVASKSASTSSSKDSSVDIPTPTLLGSTATLQGRPANTSLNSGNSFSGGGDSSQSNSLSGNITVTVVDVMANGNLVVSGKKMLTLNQGREFVSISGVVRPIDLSADNRIMSSKIAHAEITYSGSGMIADSNRAGWLTRVLNGKLWPF